MDQGREKGGTVTAIDNGKRLSEVRTVPPPKEENELSIHGRTLVKNLENNFVKIYVIYAQVTFQKGETLYYTSGDMDSMSLTQLNKKLEEDGGYKKNPGK